jgi:hypothetical protein
MRDIDEYMATPGLGGEDDATDYAEFDAGYGDAPGWYWSIVDNYRGWRGDRLLWATLLVLGFVIGLGLATLGLVLFA